MPQGVYQQTRSQAIAASSRSDDSGRNLWSMSTPTCRIVGRGRTRPVFRACLFERFHLATKSLSIASRSASVIPQRTLSET
jgi:hypothetical protein